jgi:hypothetical protein
MRGCVAVGLGVGVGALAVGAGVGCARDAGTSGTTGPCRSGWGSGCVCWSEPLGKRKLLAADAGEVSASAAATETAGVRIVQRIGLFTAWREALNSD